MKKPDNQHALWHFIDAKTGTFLAPQASDISRLYFPLMNEYGMKCSITPELKGDIAASFSQYLTPATVTEELHRNVSSRNFWLVPENHNPWSVSGNSVFQKTQRWTENRDQSEVEAQPGVFKLRRKHADLPLQTEVTVFVPNANHFVELMKVTVKNTGDKALNLAAFYALPVFGRHADNFRDHRQVTTMFQRVFSTPNSVRVKPNIIHDEHGHQPNKMNYVVMACEADGSSPDSVWPVMKDFIGEGGSLDNPEAVFHKKQAPFYAEGEADGREAVAAFRFADLVLEAGEQKEFIILHGLTENIDDLALWEKIYCKNHLFDQALKTTLDYWNNLTGQVSYHTADTVFDGWMRWVAFQLKCRQVFGNSFLPDFGYGRGGRGWRDLWQDLLSILLIDAPSAKTEILNNFKGIRIDGSNATIIGSEPGAFIADRNSVPRTWSDHGAWPVFVVNFYIQQTGDLAILGHKTTYWKDVFSHRSKQRDEEYLPKQGNKQLDNEGNIVESTIFEHLLVQQLSAFYHVGEHNNLLLEGGDWNDTLDMARDKGESVCFHHFYGANFKILANWAEKMIEKGQETIDLQPEILMLLDQLPGQSAIDYGDPKAKMLLLGAYFEAVRHRLTAKKTRVDLSQLLADLEAKSAHIQSHLQKNEWIETSDGFGFFNGHYNNHGNAIHGQSAEGVSIDLASQAIPLISGTASVKQIESVWQSVNHFLKDDDSAGLRLCSPFRELDLNIGRITGFVYGHKEHGSKWLQQNIMLAYGLLNEGFAEAGNSLLEDVYDLCVDSSKSLIFPGIPSFLEPGDRGAYAYLTGSSAWMMLTLTTQVFGIQGYFGDLKINPKIGNFLFDSQDQLSISLPFQDLRLIISFAINKTGNIVHQAVDNVKINGKQISFLRQNEGVLLSYADLKNHANTDMSCEITVVLTD